MAGFFKFILGVPGKLGVGVADEGLLPTSTLPNYSGIGPERYVQRCLAPTRFNFMVTDQNVPTVSPLGLTGSFEHGVPILGRLAEKG
jgi:hypothetical protein